MMTAATRLAKRAWNLDSGSEFWLLAGFRCDPLVEDDWIAFRS